MIRPTLFLLVFLPCTVFAASSDFEFFGFIKASSQYASHAVSSNGRNNFVAYNAAANPVTATQGEAGAYSLQVEQSRLGLTRNLSEELSGLVEVDFVDFNKSSPTVASVPRLRRLFVSYKLKPGIRMQFGQDWDVFSPLAPTTYNYVGHYFLSGDVGFMRQQWITEYTTERTQSKFAVGFPTSNNSQSVGGGETGQSPSLSVSWALKGQQSLFGFSGIFASQKEMTTLNKLESFGLNLFMQLKGEDWLWNSEVYWGQNLENIGLQALSYGGSGRKPKEWGAYSTFKYNLSSLTSVFFGWGRSQIDNKDQLLPSYINVNNVPQTTVGTSQATGYGILWNETWRVGMDHQLEKNFFLFTEVAYLQTQHLLFAQQSAFQAFQTSAVIEIGIKVDL